MLEAGRVCSVNREGGQLSERVGSRGYDPIMHHGVFPRRISHPTAATGWGAPRELALPLVPERSPFTLAIQTDPLPTARKLIYNYLFLRPSDATYLATAGQLHLNSSTSVRDSPLDGVNEAKSASPVPPSRLRSQADASNEADEPTLPGVLGARGEVNHRLRPEMHPSQPERGHRLP